MTELIGRLGYLGLAIEAVAGTPESAPDITVPFVENSLRGHHEPIADVSVRGSRIKDTSSVAGKKWGEGSVQIYLDSINSGYLLKLAFGQEVRTQKNATPPVHDHLMHPTVSGNAVTAATLWDYKGVDTERYSYAAIDTLEIEVNNEGLATITGGFMSKFPATVSAPARATTSGTLYTWKDMTAGFGTTVQVATDATPTKLTNFKLSYANNLSLHYKSGSNEPDAICYGALEVTGSYSLFFETATERDKYYNLTKNSMVVTLTGAGIASGYTEQLQIVMKKLQIEDIDMETGIDDFFALTCNYRAELDQVQAGYVEATLRNGKATDYT